MRRAVQYNLDPGQLFYTSTELDITLVAVAPMSDYGVPIERHGWLPLLPLSGKSVDGEWISIIQHPNGTAKQIAIHASQIIKLDRVKVPDVTENFIHYTTDTEPGSSGSPVLNDQWQIVAIHHKAIPAPRKRGDGGEIRWLANEGVRVSAIFNHLESKRFENENACAALDRLSRAMGFAPINVQVVQDGITTASRGAGWRTASTSPTPRCNIRPIMMWIGAIWRIMSQTSEKRLNVFTGPIFRDSDPLYGRKRKGGPWRIPLSFWKIAVLQKTDDQIAAAAFIIGQTEYVRALYEARVFSGLKPYTIDELRSRKIQTTIKAVEEATGLDFSALHAFDSHGSLESKRQTRWFDGLDDVMI